MARKLIAFGWYGGKYSHLDWLLRLLPEAHHLIRDCLRSPSLTYHYVLPTQPLAKAADPSVDAHAIQAGFSSPGAFDARTVAHDVIVPFDRANERVLGGSPEPYVNNPLRVPGVTAESRIDHRKAWAELLKQA